MKDNIRGPRLATKLFILMSLALVVIPWFSYLYLSEMEDFLVDSQANAQLLTAEGISTLLNGHPDFIEQLPQSPEGYEQLYAHPLTTPIRIPWRFSWEGIKRRLILGSISAAMWARAPIQRTTNLRPMGWVPF